MMMLVMLKLKIPKIFNLVVVDEFNYVALNSSIYLISWKNYGEIQANIHREN